MAPADDERTTSGTGNLADATVGLTVRAPHGMVAAADHLASSAGVDALRAGGTAADAAVSAGAVLAVTNQHQCGLGGDLFALVARPGEPVAALCAAGRAGSGADAAPLRADGLERMPPQGDVRAATVPGCVDGLIELHGRFGRLPLAHVLATAAAYAATGFPASPLLAATAADILGVDGADDYRVAAEAAGGRLRPGTLVRRPGVAAALEGIRNGGRAAFYEGRFGEGLVKLGEGLFTPEDLDRRRARPARRPRRPRVGAPPRGGRADGRRRSPRRVVRWRRRRGVARLHPAGRTAGGGPSPPPGRGRLAAP